MKIGLALGSGAARGLAHISVLESLDGMGLKPDSISGCSMGALVGAAYAAGFSGAALRAHALEVLANPVKLASGLVAARVGRVLDFFSAGANPVLADAEALLATFWPAGMPESFADLAIPFVAVATDLHAREAVVMREGLLKSAVAGSIAIPGLIRPVRRDGRMLVDGVSVDPVPVAALPQDCRVRIAVEVNAVPGQAYPDGGDAVPAFDALLAGYAVMEHSLMRARFAACPPEVHLVPDVGCFRPFDFVRAREILAAADRGRDQTRRAIAAALARAGAG
jgi:NTE family protein